MLGFQIHRNLLPSASPGSPDPHPGGGGGHGGRCQTAVQEIHLLLRHVPDPMEPTVGSCLIPRTPHRGSPAWSRPWWFSLGGQREELDGFACLQEGAVGPPSLSPSPPARGSSLSPKRSCPLGPMAWVFGSETWWPLVAMDLSDLSPAPKLSLLHWSSSSLRVVCGWGRGRRGLLLVVFCSFLVCFLLIGAYSGATFDAGALSPDHHGSVCQVPLSTSFRR